ncbi:MAG: type II toxin-antitoxin system RelE/ParE family toxin [Gallionella sp.]
MLHAFQKKTQQTRKEDIALASARYKQLKGITK